MKVKNLKILINVTGLVCLYAFLAIRIFPMINAVLVEKMDPELKEFHKYGDLYYNNYISHFKEDFPTPRRNYRLSEKNPAVTDADILTFGDSFFDFSFIKTLPERLSDTLGQKVFSFMTQDPAQSNPFCILNHSAYQKNHNPKYVIFETIERNIPLKFGQAYDLTCYPKARRESLYYRVKDFIFYQHSEQLFALLLKRGYFVHHFYSYFVTKRFDLFGYISPMTDKYKLQEEPWLFYAKEYSSEPGGFYYMYTDEELSNYAENISHLGRNLKSQYNLDLIFMPVPNKYSIYHTMVNNDRYNDFLPRLYTELEKRGVIYIDLYHEYKSSTDTFYYGTDTHWNKKGLDKALDLVLQKLKGYNSLALFHQLNRNSFEPTFK